MAIIIRQEPTSPNMANSNLLWMVTSGLTGNPQYQYILDVYESGSSTRVQRIKQQPNPSNKGIFDLGTILPTQLEIDSVWAAAPFDLSPNSNKDYIVKFGEEYGTSTSSSITIYDGSNNPGEPNKTGSEFYTITNGLVEPNSGDWNFASASYYFPESASSAETYNNQATLTNFSTTQSIQDGEYHTISTYNGNVDNSSVYAQDIFYVTIQVYNSAGSNIQNIDFYNTTANNGGPRTSEADFWGDAGVFDAQTNQTRLLHIGVGPQNLDDSGNTLNTNWAYYTVTLFGQGDDGLENNNGKFATLRFDKDTANCGYPGVRFTWKNEFGVWDYFTFKLAESTNSDVERQSYEQSFVNYSTVGLSVPYNAGRRGKTQYYNKVTKQHAVESDYLSQGLADNLTELFFSTEVYVQEGTVFYPVVFTNSSVTEKTNPRTQKLFKYTAQYQYANEIRPRV